MLGMRDHDQAVRDQQAVLSPRNNHLPVADDGGYEATSRKIEFLDSLADHGRIPAQDDLRHKQPSLVRREELGDLVKDCTPLD